VEAFILKRVFLWEFLNYILKKQKRFRGEVPDIYSYDELPNKLKVQIIHIIRDTIGNDVVYLENGAREIYKYIHKALAREYGVFELDKHFDSDEDSIMNFFLKSNDIEEELDVIDFTFRVINFYIKKDNFYSHSTKVKMSPEEALSELNERFKEHDVGYQFEGEIIRLDSTYIHSEVVIPTIRLLSSDKFQGANDEYMKAHEHYRHGRNKECLAECLKSFESVMKIICKEKEWNYDQNDTSKRLIQVCFDNDLVPSYMQNQFTSLKSLLESGVPTIRNKKGGHGQGQNKTEVEDHLTRYAMNLTGSNIIFLIEQSGIK